MSFDVVYREERGELLLFPESPAAGEWIAKHLTTNIHETIRFSDINYGRNILADMLGDGLHVGYQEEVDKQEETQLEQHEFDEPQDKCPRCYSDDIGIEDDSSDTRINVVCYGCGYKWTCPDWNDVS